MLVHLVERKNRATGCKSMDIEFKEKTFEKYFGHELARLTNITFSPDQCDEAWLGFDEAFLMPEDWFSRYGPYVRRRRRGLLKGIEVGEFNKSVAERMPGFRLNLFVQFKRPIFLSAHNAKQWPDWRQSYYRYDTTPHQQEALEKIDEKSYGRAATIYASPAFWLAADLWRFAGNNTIVANSNIASATKLKGHEHYSYIEPGYIGKGHSATADIESDPLLRVIERGFEQNEPLSLNQHLSKTATTIVEATNRSDSLARVFYQARTAMGFSELDPSSPYDATAIIGIFSEAFNLTYYAIG